MKRLAAASIMLAIMFSGCGASEEFKAECKELGGKVTSESESCKKSNGKKGTRTEYECIKDGKEVAEEEGACL